MSHRMCTGGCPQSHSMYLVLLAPQPSFRVWGAFCTFDAGLRYHGHLGESVCLTVRKVG